MKLDHCHRASCVQIIDQLRTTITEKDARIAQLKAENEKLSRYKNHYEFAAATTEAVIAENEKLSLYKNLADEYGLVVFADLAELQKQRDELLAAAEAIVINAEECLDFDEFTAMLVSIDDYHKLMEAVASMKGASA